MAERVVGRARELAVLDGLLDSAIAGRGRCAVLLGEAGIGKTTLASAFAGSAASRGCTVGWGRCHETEQAPYWPWRQAVRAADPSTPLADTAAAGRPSLFAAVADGLAAATAQQPALLIVEDVHLADGPSLALLQFIAGVLPELRCMLLLTSRDNKLDTSPAAAEALAELPPSVLRIPVPPLDRAEMADLVTDVLGQPDADITQTVCERTAGNPFFVKELTLLLAARGTTGVGVPVGVQQIVSRRVARLDQRTNGCLSAAAVLGDDAEVSVLADVVELPREAVVELLGNAADAQLAMVEGTQIHFAHALVRDVLYEALTPARRSELHARTARALLESCCDRRLHRPRPGEQHEPCCSSDRLQAMAGVVAAHLRQAPTEPGAAEQAREYALFAARTAMSRAGYEQAVRFFEWVVAEANSDRAEPAAESADVRIELGTAQVLSGALPAGRETLRAVARDVLAAGDGVRAARAVLAMGGGVGGFEVDLADAEQLDLLDRALALLPPGDSVVRAAALARSALAQFHRGADSIEVAREAVEMARRCGDARVEAGAIAAWCDIASGPDFVAQRTTEARRMLTLARSHGDLALVLLAQRLLIVALLEAGDFDAADEQIDAYGRVADQLRVPLFSWPVSIWRGMRALMHGHLELADASIEAASELAARAQSENAALMVATLRLGRAYVTGTMPENRALVDEVFEPFWHLPMAQAYATYFLHAAGEHERARQLLDERMVSGLDGIARDAEWLTCMTLFGEAALQMGHRPAVQSCLDRLRPYGHLWLYDGIGAACYGRLGDYLGRFEEFTDAGIARPQLASRTGSLRRIGAVWSVCWEGHEVAVADTKGVRDLATLLSRPGTPVHVLDLAGGGMAARGDGEPVLDRQARDAYTARLRDLADEIAEAEQFADAGRLARLRDEHEFLAAELAGALGLGGRPRRVGDDVERARKAVSMRISSAIRGIADLDPALGRHLRASVRTGRQCVYDPEDEVSWQV